MINQELFLAASRGDVEKELKKHLRAFPPKGVVASDSFCVYKSLPLRHTRGILTFVFWGEIESCATGTKVHYRVRPGWDTLLFAALVLIILLVGVVYKFLGYDNTYFLLAGSAINVIFHISVFLQMIACISQFNETIKDS